MRRIADRVGDDTEYIPEGGASRIIKTVRERKADIMTFTAAICMWR